MLNTALFRGDDMYRTAIEQLLAWKAKEHRKPLIIRGARHVGKTWLMKAFGAAEYESVVYINFDGNERMRRLFEAGPAAERMVAGLELYAGCKIDPANTLLIFDEIQEVPAALAGLKYFNEDAAQYQIVCACSLSGLALHPGTSFPVGKVEFLDLYPLSFSEFLMAMGKGQYAKLLRRGDFDMAAVFKRDYSALLKLYCYIGGMPEVVQAFADNRDFNEVCEIQKRILAGYEQDFSRRAPWETAPRILTLWNSLPAQLAKENKKFIYSLIKEGARAKEYESAILWLADCGLVHKVYRVSSPALPLKAYQDMRAFKLFLPDVGLLTCMLGLRQGVLLDGDKLFTEFNGAIAEQYVLQELKTVKGLNICYWAADRGISKVDFVIDNGMAVIPVEVKARLNPQAKSLKAYREKFSPQLSIRTSMSDYEKGDRLLDLPLWSIGTFLSENRL